MNSQKFFVSMVLIALLAMIALAGAPPSFANAIGVTQGALPSAQTIAPMTWNLSHDFKVAPNQANPNPDSYGHADTWSFMRSTAEHNPSTYSLLTQFYPNLNEYPGMQGWVGPEPTGFPNNGAPQVTMNTTGKTIVWAPGAISPPGVIIVHPDSSQPAIVRWYSPFTGSIAITGGVTDLNNQYGDGILWYIDKNSTTVASGSFPNGGAQLFKDGTNGNKLAAIPVTKGDSIYFLVAPGGDYYCDSTELDVTITQLDITPPSITVSPMMIDGSGHKYVEITVRDTFSGLAKIEVLKSINANTVVPAFTVGTNAPVKIISTKLNQSMLSFVTIRATDKAGNVYVR